MFDETKMGFQTDTPKQSTTDQDRVVFEMELDQNTVEITGNSVQGGVISQGETSVQGGVESSHNESSSSESRETSSSSQTEVHSEQTSQPEDLQDYQLARD